MANEPCVMMMLLILMMLLMLMATIQRRCPEKGLSYGKTACEKATKGEGGEVSCDWRFQPANSLLKQEGTSACKS